MALWVTLGLHCGSLGFQFATLGVHFGVFLALLGTSGGHFGTLGLYLGTLGLHFGALLALWGVALDPFGNFWGKGSKKVPKMTEHGSQNGDIFGDILSFRGMESGKQRLDCACLLQMHIEPLVFSLWLSLLSTSF